MSELIDRFCEELRVKLTRVDSNVQALKGKFEVERQAAEQEARKYLDALKTRIEQERGALKQTQADMQKFATELGAAGDKKIGQWQTELEKGSLQSYTDAAERYAAVAVKVASAAIDEAERAALEAWLARRAADRAQGTKAA